MKREAVTFARMWRHLSASRDEIIDYRDRQLRRVVAHAYEHVPYYRDLFDRHSVHPRDVRGAADLARLPITSTDHIQRQPDAFVARGIDPSRLVVRMSGGSTGRPKPIRRTWAEERLYNAFRLRARRHLGLRPLDVLASVGPGRPKAQRADGHVLSKLRGLARLYRQVYFNYDLIGKDLADALERLRPDAISGYPSAIALAAQSMLEEGRRTLRPRFVTTGAEVLTPLMRRQIRDAFDAPVYDVYGAHEFNIVAWECPHTGELHTCDDHVIVEVLRDGHPVAPGDRGEVVVTALHAYAMPFIRFGLGDVATRGSDAGHCACGVPFGTIRAIQGRMLDYFPLPDGRLLHPYEIYDRLLHDRVHWARRYQVVQHRTDLIVLSAVPTKLPPAARLEEIRRDAAQVFGPGVEFRMEFVDAIPVEANGKFRVARSLVRSSYDGVAWPQTVQPAVTVGTADDCASGSGRSSS